MVAVHLTTIPCECNTAHMAHRKACFCKILSRTQSQHRSCLVSRLSSFSVRFHERFYGFRALRIIGKCTTVNSRLADTPLLRTLAITDKIQIPGYRGLTGNDSRYYGLSLIRTLNEVPSVSAITRVDCSRHLFAYGGL